MSKENISAMNASPQEYIGGAAILAGFWLARGAIRGSYEDGKNQYSEIKAGFKGDDTRTERAKAILSNWGFRRSLVAAASGARDEVKAGIQIFNPKSANKPEPTPFVQRNFVPQAA